MTKHKVRHRFGTHDEHPGKVHEYSLVDPNGFILVIGVGESKNSAMSRLRKFTADMQNDQLQALKDSEDAELK